MQNWLFLKGSNDDIDYIGIQRLIRSIAKSDLKSKIKVLIAGNIEDYLSDIVNKNKFVQPLGYLDADLMKKAIDSCTIGFGSLELYKINLNEASTLKVRQYANNGLPFIIGYHDSDISEIDEFKGLFMQVPNDNSDLPITEIYNWAANVNTPENKQTLRNLSKKHLSWTSKMKTLINALT